MKPEWRRFAPLGLVISTIAVLVSIGLYVVFRRFDLAMQISLGFIVIGLALFALLDPARTRRILTGRQSRYGSNAIVLSLAVVGIIVVLNFIGFQNSQKWDLTEGKQFTLAPETLEILGKINQPVTAQAYFTKRANSESARSLLDQYKDNSNGNFKYEFIDPDQNPAAAQQAKITRDGTIVLIMGEQKEQVTALTEQQMTGALVRLQNPQKRVVYFLSGHGEKSPDDAGQESLSMLKRTLENKNYTVKSFSLLAENKIPEDANVIVIAGPRQPLLQSEVDQIMSYQENGGALVVMSEPLPVTDFGDAPDPLADYLAQSWNVSLGKDIIVDLTSQQPFAPIAAHYGSSPITEDLGNTSSQFPTARSVTVMTNTITGISPVELVFTAQQSWAETTLDNLAEGSSQIGFDENKDTPGPITLAVADENLDTKTRLVTFGDSDFSIDANFVFLANGDLIVNSIDWAAGQEELINLTPKENTTRMMLPPQSAIMNLILLAVVIILPGLALVGGIWVFVQRRRRM